MAKILIYFTLCHAPICLLVLCEAATRKCVDLYAEWCYVFFSSMYMLWLVQFNEKQPV